MHRDTFFSCPRCACGLDPQGSRITCGQCHGTLIPEAELIDHVSGEQAKALLAPGSKWNGRDAVKFVHDVGPAIASSEPVFSCPRCATQMTKHQLFTVAIDRCRAHGLWLDGRAGIQTILDGALAGL